MTIGAIIAFINEYWGLFVLAGMILDGIIGYLPDKVVPYIGVIRRIINKLHGSGGLKSFILGILCLTLVMGCKINFKAPLPICEAIPPDSYSVLCQISNFKSEPLERFSQLLKLANVAALEADTYSALEGYAFIEEAMKTLDFLYGRPEGVTLKEAIYMAKKMYRDLPKTVQAYFEIVGDIHISVEGLENVRLSGYDVMMIKKHFSGQKAILAIYS